MRCDAMRCDAMRCDAMRCDAMRFIFSKLNIIFIMFEIYHIFTLCQAFFILILKSVPTDTDLIMRYDYNKTIVNDRVVIYA